MGKRPALLPACSREDARAVMRGEVGLQWCPGTDRLYRDTSEFARSCCENRLRPAGRFAVGSRGDRDCGAGEPETRRFHLKSQCSPSAGATWCRRGAPMGRYPVCVTFYAPARRFLPGRNPHGSKAERTQEAGEKEGSGDGPGARLDLVAAAHPAGKRSSKIGTASQLRAMPSVLKNVCGLRSIHSPKERFL